MNIRRTIAPRIEDYFFKGKAIIIYGACQVGKTTLVKAWKSPEASLLRSFLQHHKNAQASVINNSNFLRFL